MPQIKITFGSLKIARLFKKYMRKMLKQMLIEAVEKGFHLEGKKDVVVTIIVALETEGEAPVQIEVNYTVGTDEYEPGVIFNPPLEEKMLVDELIASALKKFFAEYHMSPVPYSVWLMPYDKSYFKMHE